MELQELDAHRHTASTHSGEISYLDVGTGPVALLVHGVGTNAYLWRNVIGAVAGPGRRRGHRPGAGRPSPRAAGDADAHQLCRQREPAAREFFERADRAVIRAYLEPCVGTIERGREFERLLTSLDAADLVPVEPRLRMLSVPTLLVWGTGDVFFDVWHWAAVRPASPAA
jgi:pimeloyl-ACP methyl ester carboxylesterase